jgi:hypothetical protein
LLQPTPDHEDDIGDANEHLRAIGLPFELLAFHRGRCISAVDQVRGDIVELALRTFVESGRYGTFDEWYRGALRREYTARYGLGDVG